MSEIHNKNNADNYLLDIDKRIVKRPIDDRIIVIERDPFFEDYDPDRRISLSKVSLSYSERLGVVNKQNEKGKVEKEHKAEGGSYSEVKNNSNGETHEVHHMPADSVSNLERADGPAIKMEKADHRQTASFGYSKEAQEYRAEQKKLIEEGKFREALQMDIDDIHEKFGDKYDEAIAEMLDYVDQLESEGKI